MPPPLPLPEEEEEEKPLPRRKPEPKPPKPKPKGPRPIGPLPQRDGDPGGGVATSPPLLFCGDGCSGPCAYLPQCQPPPPPSPGATVRLRSSRLPTPLVALSASLLTVSAVLLLALLVHCLVARRRRRRRAQGAPLVHHAEAGGAQVLAGAVAQQAGEGEDEEAAGGGVHHVWYIRTKGLDERAISAIAAVVYDAKKRGAGASSDGGGSCAVCLAEFRHGETLRLLPRCAHAFHRACIDTWLRAHVNCPLCRAPVQVAAAAANPNPAPGTSGRREEGNPAAGAVIGGVQTQDPARGGGFPDRAVRRAASSMAALPRRAWPDVPLRAPASSSFRDGEDDVTGLGKIRRLLKLSDALEMAGVGVHRSASFGAATCQRLPPRPGPSAPGVSADETS